MTEVRIVVGSGPNGVAVTNALLQRGFDVTMLDVGEVLDAETASVVAAMARQEPEQWSQPDKAVIQRVAFGANASISPKRVFGSSYAYFQDPKVDASADMRLYGSHAFGGLSNVWGCALLPAVRGDLSGWPKEVADGVAAAYPQVRDIVARATGADLLAGGTHLAISETAQKLLRRFEQRGDADGAFNLFPTPLAIATGCKACNGCMYGCVYGFTYHSRATIESELKPNGRFRYLGGVMVDKFAETDAGVEIHATTRSGERTTIPARQLFLAAGWMGSLRIVWNSDTQVARTLQARDATCFVVPGLVLSPGLGPKRHNGLAHLSVDLFAPPFDDKPAHVQLYFNNPAVTDGLAAKLGPLSVAPVRRVIDFAARFGVVGQGYLHSDFCNRLTLDCGADGTIKAGVALNPGNAARTDAALAQFTAAMRGLGAHFVRQLTNVIPYGGSKTAGVLPHAGVADPASTDPLGRPFGLKNVHLVDAAVMPSIPGRNHTLTMMANALRIGQAA